MFSVSSVLANTNSKEIHINFKNFYWLAYSDGSIALSLDLFNKRTINLTEQKRVPCKICVAKDLCINLSLKLYFVSNEIILIIELNFCLCHRYTFPSHSTTQQAMNESWPQEAASTRSVDTALLLSSFASASHLTTTTHCCDEPWSTDSSGTIQ